MSKVVYSRRVVASVLVWICIVCFVAGCLWYIKTVQRDITSMYESVSVRVDQTALSESRRFVFVRVPGINTSLKVKPKYQYTQISDLWFLVNKNTTMPLDYAPKNLVQATVPTYNNEPLLVREELITPLSNLYTAARQEGVQLILRSAYRSSAEQATVARTIASGYAAEPGESEHQTGLAVDFNSTPVLCGDSCSLDKKSATWLAQNAHRYGFILRYPQGKEAITGYPYEAWHFRYVGAELATALYKSGMAYEELYALFATARPRS